MALPRIPGWILVVGWLMVAVGALGLGHDLTRIGNVSTASTVFELVLDVFLLAGGALVVIVSRRERSEG
jgi:hypothetical protein